MLTLLSSLGALHSRQSHSPEHSEILDTILARHFLAFLGAVRQEGYNFVFLLVGRKIYKWVKEMLKILSSLSSSSLISVIHPTQETLVSPHHLTLYLA